MTSRKRVLLADGSEEFRWLMWKNVANHDFFSLATVGSGRDVLLCMQKQTADLLLMDTALPDVCGLTVLDELQRRGTAPQRVILLSSIVSSKSPIRLLLWASHSLFQSRFIPICCLMPCTNCFPAVPAVIGRIVLSRIQIVHALRKQKTPTGTANAMTRRGISGISRRLRQREPHDPDFLLFKDGDQSTRPAVMMAME